MLEGKKMDSIAAEKADHNLTQDRVIREAPLFVRVNKRFKLDKILFTLVAIVMIGIWSYPVLLTIMNALKTNANVMRGPLTLPIPPTLEAFFQAWSVMDFPLLMKNTAFLAIGGTALAVALSAVPAYVLSRYRLPGGELFFVLMLTGMMLPQQAVIVPLYDVMRRLSLLDSLWGLVLVHGVYGMGFTLLFLRGFMVSIPIDLEDAARVDGANDYQVFRHIIVPLAAPGIAIATSLNIISIWNELFFALIFLESPEKFPVTMGLQLMTTSRYFLSWNLPAAAIIIAQIPTILLYTFAYRFIQKGLTAGSVKG
jgi:ABC-type glycerol-3-phosphate transport system permease component